MAEVLELLLRVREDNKAALTALPRAFAAIDTSMRAVSTSAAQYTAGTREAEGATASATKAATDAARELDGLASSYSEAERSQAAFSAQVSTLAAELSGAGIAERVQTIEAALASLEGGMAGLSASALGNLAEELRALQDAGANLSPALRTVVAEQESLAASAAAASREQAAIAAIVSALADPVGQAQAEVGMLAKAVEQLGGTASMSGPALAQLGERLRTLEKSGATLSPELKKVAVDTGNAARAAAVLETAQGELASSAQGLASQLGPLGSVLTSLGPAGLGAAAVLAVMTGAALALAATARQLAQEFVDQGGRLSDLSTQFEISTRALQEYAFAGNRVGLSADAMGSLIQRASRVIAEGGEAVQGAAKALGLNFAQLRALAPEQQYEAIAAALRNVHSAGQQAALAAEFFGRGSAVLKVIRSDFQAAADDAHRFGTVMSDADVAAADALGDALGDLSMAYSGLRMELGAAIASSPEIVSALGSMALAVGDLVALLRENRGAVTGFFSALSTGLTGIDPKRALGGLKELTDRFDMFLKMQGLVSSASSPGSIQNTPAPLPVGPSKADLEAAKKAADDYYNALRAGMKAYFDELSQRRAAREGTGLLGVSADDVMVDVRRLVLEYRELQTSGDVSVGQLERLRKALQAARTELRPEQWAELNEQVADLGNSASVASDGLTTTMTVIVDQSAAASETLDDMAADVLPTLKRQFEAVSSAARQTSTGTDEIVESTINWSGVLGDVRNAFEVLGISADSFFGKILGGFASALAAAEKFKAAQKKGGLEGAVGMGLAGIQAAAGAYQSGSFAGGAASGAAFGATVGSVIPGVGTVLGGVLGGAAGGILGLFGGKAKVRAELADLRKQLLDSVGGSMDELRKRAASLGVDISKAFSTKSPKELKAIIDELNKAAEDQRKRWEGVQTAVGGLELRARGMALSMEALGPDPEAWQRMGRFAAATFAAYVRESGDVIGALREMEGSLSTLSDLQAEFGLTGSAALTKLLGYRDLLATNKGVADSLQGLNQLMKGLGEEGGITRALFQDFGADAGSIFNQLIAGGADANTAMALMQPTLQRLWEAQTKYGAITDETTASILRQAEEQGVVGANMQSVNQQILDVLLAIGEVLGASLPAHLRRMGDAAEREFGRFGSAAAGAAGRVPGVPTFPTGDDAGLPILGGERGFASGGTVRAPLSGGVAVVHGTEHIIRPDQLRSIIGAAVAQAVGAMAGASMGGGQQPIIVNVTLDGQRVAEVITRRAEKGDIAPRRGPLRVAAL